MHFNIITSKGGRSSKSLNIGSCPKLPICHSSVQKYKLVFWQMSFLKVMKVLFKDSIYKNFLENKNQFENVWIKSFPGWSWNPTIFNIIRWVAGSLGLSSHWPSVWWSKYYFDRLKVKQWVAGLDLGHSKLFIISFVKLQKK